MGMSIRAREVAAKWAAEKQAKRDEENRLAEAAAAAFRRNFLERDQVAAACGWSVHKLKREQSAGRGPAPAKTGDTKQARVFWSRSEVQQFLADRDGYNRRRSVS